MKTTTNKPIIVNQKNEVTQGNHRFIAAKKIGVSIETTPIYTVIGYTESGNPIFKLPNKTNRLVTA